jgi:hypothetical protein
MHWLNDSSSVIPLQSWLQLWFTHQNEKMDAGGENTELLSPARIVLRNHPPVLFFKLGRIQNIEVVPSDTLVLPSQNDSARYKLKGIVYSGSAHFTARLIGDDMTWTYDGQLNDGHPHAENVFSKSAQLHELDGRQAHICIYACMNLI